ncbi:MAG: tRNA pseudouridine(38-40) synthase TruA [Acidimicrobiia bacterium]|nr:tRNA pseudouridine(38-40) synthase TruA [Actinomycetota bacterium]MBL6924422.1 tRNA pseudouridine(38-40) synthase TruA [Acidimicrobiia bacterium]MBL6926192.1 tRNA pseudouridine(38-40) synthase TruA [Acidimicrobiia bacterium]
MRVRAAVAYDGAPFHGFAVNNGVRTVAGDLDSVLSRVTGCDVVVTCAGRTDRGVHAAGQVLSFDVPDSVDLEKMRRSVNRLCAPSIVMSMVEPVGSDFDARFSATGRTYRYRVLNCPDPDPLLSPTTWHVGAQLDVEAMNLACGDLIGEHDFTSFCRRRKNPLSESALVMVRRVEDAGWIGPDDNGILVFEITASAFCHQMVRSIVGVLIPIGTGELPVTGMSAVLEARDRQAAGKPAPPQGLTLWSVRYPTP